ncbi:HD-GYP domain-containing protein [Salisediminibacterium selenitireducens]|uniref:Metal dependent phosphohydrolase n=1 Tax=Bacillus selenitireducens (strain ATCC 700615 / DSM 15326 / MLS10) TaxID=439292 RepID=D6XZJ8_BACIE|nr:HD-GYP domain-containing protein [Salisediminibacterium selenitireducens]ADH98372.1 metal dependent phosphohydrolase [[Bacillus] selenitireducens MLS10]
MDHSFVNPSLQILKSGLALERASSKHSVVSLLHAFDGTEVIHHRLDKGSRWGISPDEEETERLEAVYILSGKLKMKRSTEETTLLNGDFLSGTPINEYLVLTALEESAFLYITSKPVFHYYSHDTRNFEELAIKIEQKDGYTADHCSRIKDLAMLVGDKMGLHSESLMKLHFGALLHDIGKTQVPEEILLKPSKLTEEEWAIMKLHTSYGAEMLRETCISHFLLAAEVVEQHHERYDGSGYPRGLKKEEISLEAAIVGLVDSYDAITSERVYQHARSHESALNELRGLRGIKYQPDVVDAFTDVIEHHRKGGD